MALLNMSKMDLFSIHLQSIFSPRYSVIHGHHYADQCVDNPEPITLLCTRENTAPPNSRVVEGCLTWVHFEAELLHSKKIGFSLFFEVKSKSSGLTAEETIPPRSPRLAYRQGN